MYKRLPTLEEQECGPAWWDMKFINVNGLPIPFKGLEDAQDYLNAWEFSGPKYTIWKLTNATY